MELQHAENEPKRSQKGVDGEKSSLRKQKGGEKEPKKAKCQIAAIDSPK